MLISNTMETKEVTLQIDRHSITVPVGTTILEAATEIGINIPPLPHRYGRKLDCF